MSKIICISHSAELSGATLSLLRIASFLAGEGHKITVIFPGGTGPFPEWLDMDNVETVVIPNPETGMAETAALGEKFRLFTQVIMNIQKP